MKNDRRKPVDADASEPRLALSRLRAQAAIVRSVGDQVERFARPGDEGGLAEQLVQETARLACLFVAALASMTKTSRPDNSGLFPRSLLGAEGTDRLAG
jgi:hypothetical protein